MVQLSLFEICSLLVQSMLRKKQWICLWGGILLHARLFFCLKPEGNPCHPTIVMVAEVRGGGVKTGPTAPCCRSGSWCLCITWKASGGWWQRVLVDTLPCRRLPAAVTCFPVNAMKKSREIWRTLSSLSCFHEKLCFWETSSAQLQKRGKMNGNRVDLD